ncbi:MAG TPA: capsular polysaccharide biosynthesis protein [Accumulibacter sp.]|uniref:capsular polysaccharide biosynthesis protein n=1 Tax=Accumulibacter sp. TaxID=2053492 RepID=UPI002C8205F1|nr:capsular polysaccharide biosynthesis protein [Accumulibacter sp.]HRD87083.1 capsular polysaccharide biosynthesis protein [Accumulibacter sp.]
MDGVYGVFNRGLRKMRGLDEFLGAEVIRCVAGTPAKLTATVGWGRSRFARRAIRVAAARGIPFVCLEDGFLRSVGLGRNEPPLSVVVDDLGIYYDALQPSRLESLIAGELTHACRARARALLAKWRAARVSKYNHSREFVAESEGGARGEFGQYVLVVDQTAGDASIRYGMGEASCFQRMLDAALTENPECRVLLKVHPEVMAGYKRGHFDLAAIASHPRIMVLGQDVHPVTLLEHAQTVYVVTSQMGFEGLLWGKRVRTFGMPFYAGWGLTEDELRAPERRQAVSLENLVHGALIAYPRYIDPETGKRCEVERLVDWLGLQRRMRERFPAEVVALGFSRWKMPIVRNFFQGSEVRFREPTEPVPDGALVAIWGRKQPAGLSPAARVVRLEDGFLRSVGLGAELIRPLSWVMDGRGIYYDATCPSDLEVVLETTDFNEELLLRAAALRERLVTTGLTKYNVGGARWVRPPPGVRSTAPERRPCGDSGAGSGAGADNGPLAPTPRRVILVPGQVESDASLAYGAPGIRRNVDLLRAVRTANPDAYVLYKPHPDVVAGLRLQGQGENDAERWSDEVVLDVSMGNLLPEVDEVHTLTSLTGFEALLRGKKVVCYGQPFYVGWGLTVDLVPPDRRRRRLTLDGLVAGALLLYPTYVSRTTGRFTTPERALDELVVWRDERPLLQPIWRRMIGRLFRKD